MNLKHCSLEAERHEEIITRGHKNSVCGCVWQTFLEMSRAKEEKCSLNSLSVDWINCVCLHLTWFMLI